MSATDRTRDEQMFARFELESIRRTQAALLDRMALRTPPREHTSVLGGSVVVAHRNPWVAEGVRKALEAAGIRVLECTDNGATALGVIIAEQPDCVLVSDRLAMIAAEQLLAQVEEYSPQTRQVMHAEVTWTCEPPGCRVLSSQLRPHEVAAAVLRECPPGC